MTNNNERREPAAAERCRRELDKHVGVSGPMTNSDERREPVTAERCRRVDVRLDARVAEIAQRPALDAE